MYSLNNLCAARVDVLSLAHAATAAADAVIICASIIVIIIVQAPNHSWIGSMVILKRQTALSRFRAFSSLWRPYFKKDGYYAVFTENTLFS